MQGSPPADPDRSGDPLVSRAGPDLERGSHLLRAACVSGKAPKAQTRFRHFAWRGTWSLPCSALNSGLPYWASRDVLLATGRLALPCVGRSSTAISPEYRVLTKGGLAAADAADRAGDPQISRAGLRPIRRVEPPLRGKGDSATVAVCRFLASSRDEMCALSAHCRAGSQDCGAPELGQEQVSERPAPSPAASQMKDALDRRRYERRSCAGRDLVPTGWTSPAAPRGPHGVF
jgi:hypothetical protein